jgi:sialate O-acetylesterase
MVSCLILCLASPLPAQTVWLDTAWGEGMVLQSGVPAAINGSAKAGEKLTISFRGKTYEVVADQGRQWQVAVDPGAPGGPFPLDIQGSTRIELKQVMVAELMLGQVLGDGMVLQRGGPAPVFGTAVPGMRVSVEFRGKNYAAVADASGGWRVAVDPGEAGGPFPLTITGGSTTLALKTVYVGEVWICSGQSNMRWGGRYTSDWGKLKTRLDKEPPNEQLRLQMFNEPGYAPDHPPLRCIGWQPAQVKLVEFFSATGYHFGAALQEKLRVPVGLILAAVDATAIPLWMPGRKLAEFKLGSAKTNNHYATRVRALQPVAMRGVIWWQGEQGSGEEPKPPAIGYDRMLAALIDGWRQDWGRGDFPFLYVQIARFSRAVEKGQKEPTAEERAIVGAWPRVRDQQRQVMSMVPNTAMVVSYDLTTGLLHPGEKQAVGERLTRLALAQVYGEKIEASGPLLATATSSGKEVVLTFTHAAGLTARDGEPRQFEAAGEDGKYLPVQARIDGERVRLDVGSLAGPLTVRYAHREWPDGNLYNAAGLPASPFMVEIQR